MIYSFQSLCLKTRFLPILLLLFPVLGFQWLLTGAPWALAHLKLAAHGAGVPDQGLWYTPAALQSLFESWGDTGKRIYLTVLWPSDLGFLLAYGALLTAATLYLLKKVNPAASWWYLLPILPLAASGLDLLENLTIALAVWLPAVGWEPVSWAATVFTAGKWTAFALSVAVLAVGTMVHLVRSGWSKLREITRPDGGNSDQSRSG